MMTIFVVDNAYSTKRTMLLNTNRSIGEDNLSSGFSILDGSKIAVEKMYLELGTTYYLILVLFESTIIAYKIYLQLRQYHFSC